MPATAQAMHVMAAAMLDANGRVLLAQRPAGKHLAGCWEFPGGKLEPGEAPLAALARELDEELGITLQQATPLIRIPWRYDGRKLLLDSWRVTQWQGAPQSREGQALQWCEPWQVAPAILAPADRAILQALRLPARYPITPADVLPTQRSAWLRRCRAAMADGERLLQLRLPLWPQETVRGLAAELLPMARQYDVQLLLNGDIEGARALDVGVHLESAQLAGLSGRPLPFEQAVAASCHDAAQLAQAVAVGADFATLEPEAVSASGLAVSPLGWSAFRALVEAAALPVYALGGMEASRLGRARQAGAQGVAGMRGRWSVAGEN